jgi:hypothetical protein
MPQITGDPRPPRKLPREEQEPLHIELTPDEARTLVGRRLRIR